MFFVCSLSFVVDIVTNQSVCTSTQLKIIGVIIEYQYYAHISCQSPYGSYTTPYNSCDWRMANIVTLNKHSKICMASLCARSSHCRVKSRLCQYARVKMYCVGRRLCNVSSHSLADERRHKKLSAITTSNFRRTRMRVTHTHTHTTSSLLPRCDDAGYRRTKE